MQTCKRTENFGFTLFFGVYNNVDDERATGRIEGVDLVDGCVIINAEARHGVEDLKAVEILRYRRRWVDHEACPDLALLERTEIEFGDNAEIIAAASKCFVEMRMLGWACNYRAAIC